MTASSGTVLANLAYLIGAVVLAAVGATVLWLRHRQPRSVDANLATFRRGLSALAPDEEVSGRSRQRRPVPAEPMTTGLTHVRVEPGRRPDRAQSEGRHFRQHQVAADGYGYDDEADDGPGDEAGGHPG